MGIMYPEAYVEGILFGSDSDTLFLALDKTTSLYERNSEHFKKVGLHPKWREFRIEVNIPDRKVVSELSKGVNRAKIGSLSSIVVKALFIPVLGLVQQQKASKIIYEKRLKVSGDELESKYFRPSFSYVKSMMHLYKKIKDDKNGIKIKASISRILTFFVLKDLRLVLNEAGHKARKIASNDRWSS